MLGPVAPHDLAHRRARNRQRAHDLLDRPVLLKIGATYLADQVHANHPHKSFQADQGQRKDADTTRQRGRNWTRKSPLRGSLLDANLQVEYLVIANLPDPLPVTE